MARCSPPPSHSTTKALDNGQWLPSSEGEAFGDWRCPLWEPEPRRFLCPNITWRRWNTPFCEPPAAHKVLAADGNHRTIFFVGDSLMEQMMQAVSCRVLRDAHRRNISAVLTRHGDGSSELPYSKCKEDPGVVRCAAPPGWSPLVAPPHELGRCAPYCHEVASHRWTITSCYVGAGTKYRKCSAGAGAVAVLLANHSIAHRGDLILFNEGLWHNDVGVSTRTLTTVLHDVQDQRSGGLGSLLRGRGIGLAWRETSPQHFPGLPHGAYHPLGRKERWYGPGDGCAPHNDAGRPAGREELLASLEAAGLPVLRIWGSTQSQWDLHTERRTPHMQAMPGQDCTHFCQPSGVMEAWADGTLLLAERVLLSLQATW